MNDLGFIALTIVLGGILLFILSPRRFRHWTVFAYVLLCLIIVVIGLPQQFFFILLAAALLWAGSVLMDRRM